MSRGSTTAAPNRSPYVASRMSRGRWARSTWAGRKVQDVVLGGYLAEAPDPHGVLSFVRKARLHTGPTGLRGRRDRGDDQARQDARTDPLVVRVHRSAPGTAGRRSGDDPRLAGYYWRGEEPADITDQAIELEPMRGSSASGRRPACRRRRPSTPHYPTRLHRLPPRRKPSRTDVPRSPGTTRTVTSGRSA